MNGITIKYSKYFAGLQTFLHVSAIAIIFFLDLLWWIKLIIISFIFLNFAYVMYSQVLLLSKNSIVKIWYGAKNDWYLLNGNGEKMLAEICGNSVITNFLLILNFKVLGKRRKISIILFWDVIAKEDLRRLRVQLFNSR